MMVKHSKFALLTLRIKKQSLQSLILLESGNAVSNKDIQNFEGLLMSKVIKVFRFSAHIIFYAPLKYIKMILNLYFA